MAGQDVIIKSNDNNPAEGWKVKKNFMMDITKGTMSAQSVTLFAVSADGKATPLTLNGKLELPVTPKTTKAKTEVVVGKQGE